MGVHDYSFETRNIKSNIDHILQADRLNVRDALEELGKKAELQSASGDTGFGVGLPVGYCYFNTVAGKPLWLASVSPLDGTYNWVDATGAAYVANNSQQEVTP